MATLTPYRIKEILLTDSALITGPGAAVSHYSTDSRSRLNSADTLFFALSTPSGDGHTYIPLLIAAGVRNFVVSNLPENIPYGLNFYPVENVLDAMQALASAVRTSFKGDVIAITGSCGKTVLKEWLGKYLPEKTYVSPRSFNSQIGVPLSILNAPVDAARWVIEAGISKEGEMERLRRIIHPDYAVITNLTGEHEEEFSSGEQHRAEKEIILKDIPETHIVNGIPGNTPLQETFAAVMKMLGFPVKKESLSALTFPRTRISVVAGVNGSTILHDAFTNNYESLRLALDFADRRRIPGTPMTLILADESDEYTPARLDSLKKTFGITSVYAGANPDKVLEEFRNTGKTGGGLILVKGSEESGFGRIVAELELKQHETVMEINLDNLIHNFNFFRSLIPRETGICVMLKADGYGCGSLEPAKTLQSQGAAAIAVAVVDEGVALRDAGITLPIIVLNPRGDDYGVMFNNRLEPEIYSLGILKEVICQAELHGIRNYPVHIKLDTGMHRLGFSEETLPELMEILLNQNKVKVESVFSHLATADCLDMDGYTDSQLTLFSRMTETIRKALPYRFRKHILNTAGILRRPEYASGMVRLGIGLYGLPVIGSDLELNTLKPVAALYSTVIALAKRHPGDTVGYSRRGVICNESLIATVPVGYADGIDRRLGNGNTYFVINGVRCPTVGNICMDLCMIDVTEVPDVKVGDRVEIFGTPDTPLCRLSDTLDTIPYEIQTSISPRVKRIYFRD